MTTTFSLISYFLPVIFIDIGSEKSSNRCFRLNLIVFQITEVKKKPSRRPFLYVVHWDLRETSVAVKEFYGAIDLAVIVLNFE